MSKAIIVKHEGKGQYLVDVVYDAAYIQKIIDRLNLDYAQLQFKDLVKALDAKAAQQSKVDDAAQTVYDAINVYNSDPTEANLKKVATVTEAAFKVSEDFEVAVIQLDFVKTRMDAVQKRISLLRNFLTDKVRRLIWCADLADGKKDRRIFYPGNEVGMMEISGDEKLGQNLHASYAADVWKYVTTRDGNLMNIAGMSHFEVFYNLAIFPGWQKWRHRYRTGKITAGDQTAGWTVVLDPLHSSEQQIQINNVNDTSTLTGIHAQYMSCNDAAFGIKDHVVLDVVISGAPPGFLAATIIGFVDHPKACVAAGFGYYVTGTGAEWQRITDEAGPWTMKRPYNADLTTSPFGEQISSWIGQDQDGESYAIEFTRLDPLSNGIFIEGKHLADVPNDQAWVILGAALTENKKYLYVAMSYAGQGTHITLARMCLFAGSTGENDAHTSRTVFLGGSALASSSVNGNVTVANDALLAGTSSAKATLTASLSVTHEWELHDIDLGAYAHFLGGEVHFNSSCTRALSMWEYTHGAKRTPQSAPAPGSTWTTSLYQYADYWREKLEITIGAPEANSITTAGISFTNYGLQGYVIQDEHLIVDVVTEAGITRVARTETETWTGSYQWFTGFIGDTEIIGSYFGEGETIRKGESVSGGGTTSQTTSVSGTTGLLFKVPYIGLSVPRYTVKREGSGTYDDSSSGATVNSTETTTYITIRQPSCDLSKLLVVVDGAKTVTTDTEISTSTTHADYDSDHYAYENGQLWCGEQVDGEEIQTLHTTSHINATTQPLIAEDTSVELHTVYDRTGFQISDGVNIGPVLEHAYTHHEGAMSSNKRFMAVWGHTRSAGFVPVIGSSLTGGDMQTLDAHTGDRTYFSVHAL